MTRPDCLTMAMIIRITEGVVHETSCLQDSILTHKTDDVCRCCEIRECVRVAGERVVSFNCIEYHSQEAPFGGAQCTITSNQ